MLNNQIVIQCNTYYVVLRAEIHVYRKPKHKIEAQSVATFASCLDRVVAATACGYQN